MSGKMNVNGYISDWVGVEIDTDDVINELSDNDIIAEYESRGLEKKPIHLKFDITKQNLCDLFGVNYHTDIDILLEKLEQKLNTEL